MLKLSDMRKPRGWEVYAGADTGTYMGGVICLISPQLELFVVEEFPNYRYVGDGTIEEIGMTVSEWIRSFALRLRFWTGETKVAAWVDANTTFKTEVGHGLRFRMNKKPLELRTEITREYMRNSRIHLMPWLKVLPYELQEAKFPEHESAGTGRMQRIKVKDHTLDGLEHVCSRRPHPDFVLGKPKELSAMEKHLQQHSVQQVGHSMGDPHLGAQ